MFSFIMALLALCGAVASQRFEVVQTLGDGADFFPRSKLGYGTDPNGVAWFFGGNREMSTVSNDLFSFEVNNEAGTYRKIQPQANMPVPTPRASVSLAVNQDYVLIVGGVGADGSFNDDVAWIFNRSTQAWENVSQGGPSPRSQVGVVSYKDTFIVIGGKSQGSPVLNEVWEFTLSTKTWRAVPLAASGMPLMARASPYVHAYQDTIMVVGGVAADGSFVSAVETTTQAGSTLDQNWMKFTPSTTPEQSGGAFHAVLDGAGLFLFGGSVSGGSSGCGLSEPVNATDRTWFFDLGSDSWIETLFRGSKPPKLAHPAGVFIEPYFYSMGGFEFECDNGQGGPDHSSVTYRYRVVVPTHKPTDAPTLAPTREPDDDILRDTESSGLDKVHVRHAATLGILLALFL